MTIEQQVATGIRRIALPLTFAPRSINAYLLEGDRGWSLVDSGMHTVEAEATLRSGLDRAGIQMRDLSHVFVTHLHADHLGMAGTLRESGAELLMHGPEIEAARDVWGADHRLISSSYSFFERHGLPPDADQEMRAAWIEAGRCVDPFEPMRAVADGETIDLCGRALTVVWTPGHTDYHAVLFERSTGTLLAGDHVLPRITSHVGLYPASRDDPLGDFLAALAQMKTLGVRRVLPGHGEPFDDCSARVDELLAHHSERLEDVLNALDGGRDAYGASRILFPQLHSPSEQRAALAETLAHLRYLQLRGRVREVDSVPIRWRAA